MYVMMMPVAMAIMAGMMVMMNLMSIACFINESHIFFHIKSYQKKVSKCSNLIYTICGTVFKSIPVRSEGEYKHIRLSDKPEAAKKKLQIV